MKSDVFFVKIESTEQGERVSALKKLLEKIGPLIEYRKNEIVPLKVTIGDAACIYNLNPELVKCVVALVRAKGAKPVLFDTNVIYQGQRQNSVDHLNLVQSKGFGHSKTGAPFLIADGLLGQDGKEFEIGSQNIKKKIRLPSFIGMLDSLLVLSHATGHILSGYAGALKNVAMGISCRSAKQLQHSSLKPSVIENKCTACGCCVKICPVSAISFENKKAFIDQNKCLGCAECICACKFDAVYVNWHEDSLVFGRRMSEVANFILSKFKNKFFITFALDITKECDCISTKEEKMIADNFGILASQDPVAVDKAVVDLVNKDSGPSYLKDNKGVYEDMLKYAAQIGAGSLGYNLITL